MLYVPRHLPMTARRHGTKLLQQASTTREAERYKIHPAKPGPPEKKKRKKGKGLEESRLTHTKNARRGRAARDQPELNLELLGQSRRRKNFLSGIPSSQTDTTTSAGTGDFPR